jgi:hypothetical protein
MPAFSYPELNSNPGTATADGLRNIANTAANAVCSAWRNYARATTGFPDPTGIGAFNNALFSRLCEPRGITAPVPEDEFVGGQCPILYDLTVAFNSAPGLPEERVVYRRVLGPVGGAT